MGDKIESLSSHIEDTAPQKLKTVSNTLKATWCSVLLTTLILQDDGFSNSTIHHEIWYLGKQKCEENKAETVNLPSKLSSSG